MDARPAMKKYLCNDPGTKSVRRRLRKHASDAERKLWSVLRGGGIGGLRFFRQYSIGPYVLDFYCPKRRLAIEVDGGQHAEARERERDAHRDRYLNHVNIRVIRLWNHDVLQNVEGVYARIAEEVGQRS